MLFAVMNDDRHIPKYFALEQAPSRAIPEEILELKGAESGPVIPGIRQGAVPQGLAYSAVHERIFISVYFENSRHPSSVAIIDRTSGRVMNTLILKESGTEFHYGHVGGLAVDEQFLWVASHDKVYQYDLCEILAAPPVHVITPQYAFTPEASASFSTFADGTLFIGEFVYQGSTYRSKTSHHTTDRTGKPQYAWICGYDAADLDSHFPVPTMILSVRQKVQGIQVADSYIALSISYGRRNDSVIAIHNTPLLDTPHARIPWKDGHSLPLWYLDERNRITEIRLPPLAEGITMIDGRLAVLFESGAEKFQDGGKQPYDHLLFLDVMPYLAHSSQ